MNANKQIVRTAFEAMGRSDIGPLVALMRDDFAWVIEGQSRFSRRYQGKAAVKRDLLDPLFQAFATPYRFTIDEIIAEGDRVVVLGRGEVKTKAGKDYNNSYCFSCDWRATSWSNCANISIRLSSNGCSGQRAEYLISRPLTDRMAPSTRQSYPNRKLLCYNDNLTFRRFTVGRMGMVSQMKTHATAEQDAFLELPRRMTHGGRPAPRIDAVEADGMIEMIAEVPGVPESAIDVTLDGDILTIEIDKGHDNQGKRALFAERVFGHFRRSIQLPFAPEPDKVQAALQDGLLTISFPRVEQSRTHRVAVRATQGEARGQGSAIGSSWPERADTLVEPLTLDVKATAAPPMRGR